MARPARAGHDGLVMRHGLRVVSIVVRKVDLAVARCALGFEGHLGLGDAGQLGERHRDVIGQGVHLRAVVGAGVSLGQHFVFGDLVGQAALDASGVAPGDEVFGLFQRHMDHPHEEQVELEHAVGLAVEAAHVDRNRLEKTQGIPRLNNDNVRRRAGQSHSRVGEQGRSDG